MESLEVNLKDCKPSMAFEIVWYLIAVSLSLPNQFDFKDFVARDSSWTIFQKLANPKIVIGVLTNVRVEPESDDDDDNEGDSDNRNIQWMMEQITVNISEALASIGSVENPFLQVGVSDEVFIQLSGIDEVTLQLKVLKNNPWWLG